MSNQFNHFHIQLHQESPTNKKQREDTKDIWLLIPLVQIPFYGWNEKLNAQEKNDEIKNKIKHAEPHNN